MSQIHKILLSKNKRDLKLPSSPSSFADHCSTKLIQLMTNEDKILVENTTVNGKRDSTG